jgi:hypothetical protein
MTVGSVTPIRYDLAKYAVVTSVVSPTQFIAAGFAGYPDGYFASSGIIVGWGLYVLHDLRTTAAVVAAPQGEQTFVTASTQVGLITHPAFTVPLVPGDEILLLHPNISAAWVAALATQNVPGIDSLVDLLLRDVVGNKADTPNTVIDNTSSLMRYVKSLMGSIGTHLGALAYIGQCPVGMAPSNNNIFCPNIAGLGDNVFVRDYQMIILNNANAPGNPPEFEMRDITNYGSALGQFATAAFSANVEQNDLVLVIHNSLAVQISAFGIADAGSGAANVRDADRVEADDWWNGQTVMLLSGAARGQKRPIGDFLAASDDIIPAPAFDAAVAAGDRYVILAHYNPIVTPAANSAANYLASDVVGRKDDTAIAVADNVSSIIRYLKGIIAATANLIGAVTAAVYAHPNGLGENDALIFAAANQQIDLRFDVNALTQATTIREYEQVDAANYREISAKVFPADFDPGCTAVALSFVQANALYKITFQSAVAEGAGRNVPYRYITRDLS